MHIRENVILSDTDYNLLCQINKFVEEIFYYNSGKIRSVPVLTDDTTWKTKHPLEPTIRENLKKILNNREDNFLKITITVEEIVTWNEPYRVV